MHIAEIDNIANNGKSLFHRAHPSFKLILAASIVAAFISSYNLLFLGILLIFVLFLYFLAGLGAVKMGHLALYPAFFSVVFALILSQGSVNVAAIIIIRAVGAALTLIFLFSTTPYIDLFSCLSKFMPPVLGDVFLFTYRGLFILLHKSTALIQTIRMRGGFRLSLVFYDFKNIASIIGLLFVESISIGERMYQAFDLRGYEGYLPRSYYNRDALIKEDYGVLFLSIIVLSGAVIVRWI